MHTVPIYIKYRYAAQGAHVYWYISVFLFSKSYWLSKIFLLQGMKYLLLTWSSFVWYHVISSVPSQMLIIKTLSSLFGLMCFARVNSEISRNAVHSGDGLCGHWYILRLMTTHTWCKLGHCNSVAVTSLSGVKSEPTVACLANPPFRAISTFSSPKWGPPRAMKHKVYLSSCPLTLNQYNYPVGSTLQFLQVVERNIVSHGKHWEVCIESRYVYQSCFTVMSFSSLRPGWAYMNN